MKSVSSMHEVVERGGQIFTFGGQKAVVEVEPTNDGANVEGATDRIELVISPGHLGPWNAGKLVSAG